MMPHVRNEVMQRLYAVDIWAGYSPSREVPPEVQGWNGNHPSLARLAEAPGQIVIDVGVWKGQSTITMANAMRGNGIDGCIIAVDTFLGSPEHWDSHLSRKYGMPDLYETFLGNVWNAGLTDYIVPLPQTSVTAAMVLRAKGISAKVAHIDAAHEYEEVMRDAVEYWSLLDSGGYLIGDDYHETWPGVVRAAGEFSARHSLPLVIEPPKWIVRKP
jgi:hypothetical protein